MENSAAIIERLAARVDELESRAAIRDLASNYCHGFDKRDFERFLSIWWPDCVWDIGPPADDLRLRGNLQLRRPVSPA